MDSTTECAPDAESQLQDKTLMLTHIKQLSNKFLKAYYHLTIYLPRPLPRNIDQFMALKEIMIKHYGIEDNPAVWFTVCGQITATPPTQIRKAYIHFVNAAKRLDTNRLARDAKIYFNKLNEDKIKELTEKIIESPEPEPPPTAA